MTNWRVQVSSATLGILHNCNTKHLQITRVPSIFLECRDRLKTHRTAESSSTTHRSATALPKWQQLKTNLFLKWNLGQIPICEYPGPMYKMSQLKRQSQIPPQQHMWKLAQYDQKTKVKSITFSRCFTSLTTDVRMQELAS